MAHVYKISSDIDNRIYIGGSKHLRARVACHTSKLRKGDHPNKPLQDFVNKYGVDCLRFDVVEECLAEDVLSREQYYLDKFDNLFNIAKFAQAPMQDLRQSKEAREKISRATRGKNNPMYGTAMPKWLKGKLREINLGRPKTKAEKLLQIVNLSTRKEVVISRYGKAIHCFNYAHAANLIGASPGAVRGSVVRGSFSCKGWAVTPAVVREYTEEVVMSNIDKFNDLNYPTVDLIKDKI